MHHLQPSWCLIAYVGPLVWNCIPPSICLELLALTPPQFPDAFRLSCSLAQALMPVETAADMNGTTILASGSI